MVVELFVELLEFDDLIDFQDALVDVRHFGELHLNLVGQPVDLGDDLDVFVSLCWHELEHFLKQFDHVDLELEQELEVGHFGGNRATGTGLKPFSLNFFDNPLFEIMLSPGLNWGGQEKVGIDMFGKDIDSFPLAIEIPGEELIGQEIVLLRILLLQLLIIQLDQVLIFLHIRQPNKLMIIVQIVRNNRYDTHPQINLARRQLVTVAVVYLEAAPDADRDDQAVE